MMRTRSRSTRIRRQALLGCGLLVLAAAVALGACRGRSEEKPKDATPDSFPRALALGLALFEKSPEEVEKLAAALPQCTLAAAEPFCLGSGWLVALVALVPAIAALSGLARRRRTLGARAGQRDV